MKTNATANTMKWAFLRYLNLFCVFVPTKNCEFSKNAADEAAISRINLKSAL